MSTSLAQPTSASAPTSTFATLETLNFDNLALRSVPIDPEKKNFPRQVPNAIFSLVNPTPVNNPSIVAVSPGALSAIDLRAPALSASSTSDAKSSSSNDSSAGEYIDSFTEYFSGNKVLPGARPAAHCYCGHQFGHFSGQLGDGATMYLGEVVNSRDERWELQFKGAGLTPFSRTADGRKVLRSSIREFLCSEHLHYLGISSTRSPSIITSDSRVVRDMFYDGNPERERCTVITRIAPTFIRFGSFEIFKHTDSITGRTGPSAGNKHLLVELLNYVVRNFYPAIWAKHHPANNDGDSQSSGASGDSGDSGDSNLQAAAVDLDDTCITEMAEDFLLEVTKRTAHLAAQWMCVGWCHGVLNTDNMSIVGTTIDYGPYGFMDRFNPDFVCNASDNDGRYSYKAQPERCEWNCTKLAEALEMVLPLSTGSKEKVSAVFQREYKDFYLRQMRQKLGLVYAHSTQAATRTDSQGADSAAAGGHSGGDGDDSKSESKLDVDDELLIASLLATMHETAADMTNVFRGLTRAVSPTTTNNNNNNTDGGDDDNNDNDGGDDDDECLAYLLTQCGSVEELKDMNRPSIPPYHLSRILMAMQQQPDILKRIGVSEETIHSELSKMSKLEELAELTADQKRTQDRTKWQRWLKKYRRRLRADRQAALAQTSAPPSTSVSASVSASSSASASASSLKEADVCRTQIETMDASNPSFVLRNWVLESAIRSAKKGDFSGVQRLHAMIQDPFKDHKPKQPASQSTSASAPVCGTRGDSRDGIHCDIDYCQPPPAWAKDLQVS